MANRTTRDVDAAFARLRLDAAHAFRRQAGRTAAVAEGSADLTAAASSAVDAAIAGADAACAAALGQVWIGAHSQAPNLLAKVTGSQKATVALKRILGSKTDWQYASKRMTSPALDRALAQADTVIDFGAEMVRRHLR